MRFTALCLIAAVASTVCAAEDVSVLISTVQKEKKWPAEGRAAFQQGVCDWHEGRLPEARNNWVRAEAWMRMASTAEHRSHDAMIRLVEEADRVTQPAPPPVELTPAPEPPKPKRRARRNRDEQPAPLDARAIMESARAAREAGQTEKALRLMRIASGMPGGEEAVAQADALERELVQPAR